MRRFERRRFEPLIGSWIASSPGDVPVSDLWAVAFAQDLDWVVVGAVGAGITESRDAPIDRE